MPFHVFLTQSLSLTTGHLGAWKAAKDVLAALLLVVTLILVWCNGKASKLFKSFFLLSTFYFLLHLVTWAINPEIYKNTAVIGTVYNNRIFGYLLIGMGAGLLWAKKIKQDQVIKIVLIVSTIVCVLGVLQYFLPKDILTHLGYSVERGVKPAFFIDDKPDLPRIMSTLRDPNSLGAFLIVPINILLLQLADKTQKRRRMQLLGMLMLHGLALFLTFSRGAWMGAGISIGLIAVYKYRHLAKTIFIKYWPLIIGGVLLLGSLVFMVRGQYAVQNILEHSDENTTAQLDSNKLHADFVRKAVNGIKNKPQGHGPGTAGIVSILNPNGGFLTENYYLQIGYEVGILGLGLFLAVLYKAQKQLSERPATLPAALWFALWSYLAMSLVAHLWTNETVATQWWLLTGFVIVLPKTKKA